MTSPRETFDHHSPLLAPFLTVRDVRATAGFYERASGFTLRHLDTGPGDQPVIASMTGRGSVDRFAPEGVNIVETLVLSQASTTSPVIFYGYCDDG